MNLKPFLSWCTEQGIRSPLEIRVRSDGYRYMVLKPDAELVSGTYKQPIIQCPLTACITGANEEELADRLMYEMNNIQDSQYEPYLRLLPDTFPDMPRFWNPKRLQGVSQFDGGVLEQNVAANDAARRGGGGGNAWALACVDSRANYLPDGTFSMTPYLDMLNHNPNIETTARVDDNEQLFLEVVSSSLQQRSPLSSRGLFSSFWQSNNNQQQDDKEVQVSYGALSNLQTLLDYGFVAQQGDADNPFNRETFTVRMMRQSLVAMTVLDADGSLDPVALGAIRARVVTSTAEQEEYAALLEGPIVPFLSKANEVEARALVAGCLEEALSDARAGAQQAQEQKDTLVQAYLNGRAKTLQKGLTRIEKLFPAVFG